MDNLTLVRKLREHAHRLVRDEAMMRLGYGAVTDKEQREELEEILDRAADEIEKTTPHFDLVR